MAVNTAKAGEEPGRTTQGKAFTLLEVLVALAILGLTCSSVLLVINRCMASTANSAIQMEAFQVAHENMERVLASESVSESVEYGTSELYPDISWQTVIEAFSEPMTGQMWVRAVCSADYVDSVGEMKTLELVHWIGSLTDQQVNQLSQEEDLEALAAEQLIDGIEQAAEYAGVDVGTIEEWIEKGLQMTDEGAFIKYNLDIYRQGSGEPSEEDRARQVRSIEELAAALSTEQETGDDAIEGADGTDPTTGLPYDQLQRMDVGDVMDRSRDRQNRPR
ncbi:MAG: type II secretion system protein [Phycisphaerales bacterium]|nr:MAG: type II secretion system protein [Phycisphaerales bacterium]